MHALHFPLGLALSALVHAPAVGGPVGAEEFFLRLYTPLSNLGPAQLESRASHECAEALPVRDPAGPIYKPPRSHYQP